LNIQCLRLLDTHFTILPLFFVGLLCFNTPLSAQWTLTGQVQDAESGEGLSYVNIVFENQSHLNTTSNQQGALDWMDYTMPGMMFLLL
jgi:hypothetical protein